MEYIGTIRREDMESFLGKERYQQYLEKEEWHRTFGWRGAHPRNLSQKEVENCVFDMWTLYGEHGFICDLDVEMYSELIPLYLGTTFDEDCDYSFTHFASGDIRTIKMYEWERNA